MTQDHGAILVIGGGQNSGGECGSNSDSNNDNDTLMQVKLPPRMADSEPRQSHCRTETQTPQ